MTSATSRGLIGRRVVVIGSGGGKTHLAGKLARLLDTVHIELDSLAWEPGWVEADLDTFRERIRKALSGESWVADGNYSKARNLIWSRADTIVWVDYPRRTVMRRTLIRTLRRIVTREELWGKGNCETVANAFFSRDSLLWFKFKTYHPRRRMYARALADEWSHLHLVRLRSPKVTEQWLSALAAQAPEVERADVGLDSEDEVGPSRLTGSRPGARRSCLHRT